MLSRLRAVEIEINHDCNKACMYCPNAFLERRSKGWMSEPLFKRILGELQAAEFKGRLRFHFYNEPLLAPHLEHFARLAKDALPESFLEIYTNGTLLTEQRLFALLSAGIDGFVITKHMRSAELPLEKYIDRLPPETRARIHLQTYKELHLTNRGGLLREGACGSKPPALDLPCFVPSSLLVVTVSGNVLPCFEDFEEKHAMGNLRDSTLQEIWESEKYRSFRESLKRKERFRFEVCRDCNRSAVIP